MKPFFFALFALYAASALAQSQPDQTVRSGTSLPGTTAPNTPGPGMSGTDIPDRSDGGSGPVRMKAGDTSNPTHWPKKQATPTPSPAKPQPRFQGE